jgi:hypothetical protein
MDSRKARHQEQKIPLKLTAQERELIINKTLTGPDLTERLKLVLNRESVFAFTLDELDELVGYIAAEANHTKSKKIQKELDRLYDRIQYILDTHTDEEE